MNDATNTHAEHQVVMRPAEDLRPYERNARTHSAEQIAKVARSIREFGWTNPILVDRDGMVVAGHARLEAAKSLGMTEVPTIALAHLSPEQVRAYIIADNQLALDAGWDKELLGLELGALRDLGFDLTLTGFGIDDLASLAPLEPTTGLVDEDQVPEPPDVPTTRPGDLWILGDHRLLCGDATSAADVERLLAGERASMAFTDPPYNVDYHGAAGSIENDDLGAGFGAFLESACQNLLTVTDGAVYICMSSGELDRLQAAFRSAGGHWSTFVIWAKDTFTLGRSDYQRQYEPILYGWREGGPHFWCGARDQGDVWNAKRPRVNDLHPTMKPVELVRRAIQNSSRPGEILVDLFGGAGPAIIGAEQLQRRAAVMELEPRFCDVIVHRWQQFTGRHAVLESDGRTFAEMAVVRAGDVGAQAND